MHRRAFPLACLVAAALCYSAWVSGATLYPTSTFQAGNNPAGLVLADLRGTGFKDIVEIGQNGYIEVLLNDGKGNFTSPAVSYISDGQPTAVVVADVNGDNIPDIIVTNAPGSIYIGPASGQILTTKNGNDVTVLLGNGDGTFRGELSDGTGIAAPNYAVGGNPLYLAVADVNGDGHPDIVVANSADNDVGVLLNSGTGTFSAQVVFGAGTTPDCVALADVNGDGILDILVANSIDNSVGVLLGKGNGAFGTQIVTSLGSSQTSSSGSQFLTLATGKLDASGRIDVVVGVLGNGTASVAVLSNYNPATGTFTVGPAFAAGLRVQTLLLADVHENPKSPTANGFLDLIAVSSADNVVDVLAGNGDGTFGASTQYALSGVSTNSAAQQTLAVGDVNGDGYADLVAASPTDNILQVLNNAGASGKFPAGTFHSPNTYSTGTNPSAVVSGVLTTSKNWDVVVANAGDNTIGVLLGNGDGTLKPMVTYPAGKSPQALVLADVSGDGKLDVVTANYGDGTVSVLLGNGDGTFKAQQVFTAVPGSPGATVLGVTVVDVNGDKIPDLVVSNGVSNTFSVLLGNGDGTFQAPVSYVSDNSLDSLVVADVDGDGLPDVITIGGTVTIFHNATATCPISPASKCQSFQALAAYSVAGVQAAIADVNHDGVPDLVIADYTNGRLGVMLGNPGTPGTFLTPTFYPSGGGASSVLLAGIGGASDLNGDGNVDAVLTNSLNNTVSVMFGNGARAFIGKAYPVEINPRSAAVGYFTDVGTAPAPDLTSPDIVVANHGSNTLSVMLQVPGAVAGDVPPTALAGTLTVPDGKFPTQGGVTLSNIAADAVPTAGIVSFPGQGSVNMNPATGVYLYQANAQFVGVDSFQFQVSDGVKLSNIGTVTITVQSNSAVTSSSGVGAFGILPFLMLVPFLRRRRRVS